MSAGPPQDGDPPGAPGDAAAPSPELARVGERVGLAEVRAPSRLGALATLARRGLRRLLRFQLRHQQEFNESVYRALAANEQCIRDLSRGLSQVIEDSLQRHGEHLGLVSRTIEQLQADHGALYETVRAQGRHLDDLELRSADASETLAEAEKREERFEERVAESVRELGARFDELRHRFQPNLAFDHFEFQRTHRGEESELRQRLEHYAEQFGAVRRVLDAGCGRGEFLEACHDTGVGAYGVESDPDMVSRCRMKDLEVVEEDLLVHLRSLEDRSLDGLFMAQVIEHLTYAEIIDFLTLAADKLKRGAKIIIETINPGSFSALRWFFMDPTHRQPVSPETLKFLLVDKGFRLENVLYSGAVPAEQSLERLRLPEKDEASDELRELLRGHNANVDKLNEILFGSQDYALIAER